MPSTIRKEVIEAVNVLPEEDLITVMEYIQFLREPEEIEPTVGEMKAIATGKDEYSAGEYVPWRKVKSDNL